MFKVRFLLPEATQQLGQSNLVDVEIIIDDVPIIEDEWTKINYYFAMKENVILFQVPDVATFFIKDGKQIIVTPETECQ